MGGDSIVTGAMIEIGPGRWAHPSGALWLPKQGALLIADAHLGYGWAQRRRGELGALNDEDTAQRLRRVAGEVQPRLLVLLGDVVHAPGPGTDERGLIEQTLHALADRSRLVLVRGNHDRAFETDFAFPMVPRWRGAGVLAVHGDALPRGRAAHVVAGHWHPAYTVHDDAGVRRRLPVFFVSERLTVMPAFTSYSAGINLRRGVPAELQAFAEGGVRLYATTGRQVVPLGRRTGRNREEE